MEAPISPTAHTHDGFFKAVFSEPEHAVAFFRSHLPPEITARIDWTSLTVLPGSFVKSNLQQRHSDLLFSVLLGKKNVLLYLLFEHQSTPDPGMPLRLLGYLTEIFIDYREEHGFPLPPVLPFVFHQGPDQWTQSPEFANLYNLPEDLAEDLRPYLLNFRHALLDLSRFDPASEEDDIRMRVVLQLMKLSREKKLPDYFQWLARFSARDLSDKLLGLLLLYALYADSNLDAESIFRSLSPNPELVKNAMSVAEQLKAEGRVEGEMIGRIRGLEDLLGYPASSREILLRLSEFDAQEMYKRLQREAQQRFNRN